MLLRTLTLSAAILLVAACDEDVEDVQDVPADVRAAWDAFDADGASQLRSPTPARCPMPSIAQADSCWVLPEIGQAFCSSGAPVNVVESNDGIVLDIDMTGRRSVAVDSVYLQAQGYLVHVTNAPETQGGPVDDPTTSYDSQMVLRDTQLSVFASDQGGNEELVSQPNAIDATQDRSTMVVCDGFFAFRSTQGRLSVRDENLFQIGGDEPDAQAGDTNDSLIHVAFERTVSGTEDMALEGDGVSLARIRISR